MKNLFAFILIVLSWSVSAQKTIHLNKYLRSNIGTITLWDGKITRIYGITDALAAQPSIPASTIICNEGDTVIINALSISQGDHHTIHLHGLDVDTRNDGDPMTSFWLQHLQDTTYTFIAKHAGTYIYHCHVGDVAHVQMGMYGLVIVRAKGGLKTAWTGGPAFDKEYAWLMSEIDKSWHDTIPVHDPKTDQVKIPKYVPDYFLVNGKSRQQIWGDTNISINSPAKKNIYVRLTNIGFSDHQVIFPKALNAVLIDSDGRPLPSQVRSDTVVVSPGERYGVMLAPTAILNDSIIVNYISLNTSMIQGTEKVPVTISHSTNINTLTKDNILIYPNPANNSIHIADPRGEVQKVQIYDAFGRLIYFVKTDNIDIMNIPVSDIADGLYTVRLETHNGVIAKTVVVQH
jgi:FtsP/CotA-like multicopper oxidase with cupredoxin domain